MLPFWIALQFLSSLPVSLPGMPTPAQMGVRCCSIPLVGLAVRPAAVAGQPPAAGRGGALQAALLLALWVLLSGALHLDGLADSADAWLGGFGDRERTLQIMKDPRSGPIAVVTLVLVLLLKFCALWVLVEQGRAVCWCWRRWSGGRRCWAVPDHALCAGRWAGGGVGRTLPRQAAGWALLGSALASVALEAGRCCGRSGWRCWCLAGCAG
jgi:adenosylcobinamide-GDP ribazoletransferase